MPAEAEAEAEALATHAARAMIAVPSSIAPDRISRMCVEFRHENYARRTPIVPWERFVMPYRTRAVPMALDRIAIRPVLSIAADRDFVAMREERVNPFRVTKVLPVRLGKNAIPR